MVFFTQKGCIYLFQHFSNVKKRLFLLLNLDSGDSSLLNLRLGYSNTNYFIYDYTKKDEKYKQILLNIYISIFKFPY